MLLSSFSQIWNRPSIVSRRVSDHCFIRHDWGAVHQFQWKLELGDFPTLIDLAEYSDTRESCFGISWDSGVENIYAYSMHN
jgi:hypothetical protein